MMRSQSSWWTVYNIKVLRWFTVDLNTVVGEEFLVTPVMGRGAWSWLWGGKLLHITSAAFLSEGQRQSASFPRGGILRGACICCNCRCLLRGWCIYGSLVVSFHSATEMCDWSEDVCGMLAMGEGFMGNAQWYLSVGACCPTTSVCVGVLWLPPWCVWGSLCSLWMLVCWCVGPLPLLGAELFSSVSCMWRHYMYVFVMSHTYLCI